MVFVLTFYSIYLQNICLFFYYDTMSNALITNGVLERIDGMSNEELDATYVQWKGILYDAGVTLVSKFQGQFYTTPKGISWKQDYIGILHKHMNEILTNLSSCDEVQRWKDCRDAMTTIARAIISKGSVSPHSDEAKQFLDSIQKEHVSEKPRPVYNKGQMITNDPMARTYLLSTTFWNILSEVNTYENYIECIHANETWEKLHFKPLEQG